MRAPTLYSHKILYVGAAIGRPVEAKAQYAVPVLTTNSTTPALTEHPPARI